MLEQPEKKLSFLETAKLYSILTRIFGSTKEETTAMLNQIAEDAQANGKVLISINGLPITLIPSVPMKGLTADENVKIVTALIVPDEVYSEYVDPDTVTVYHNFCIPSETVEVNGLMASIMERVIC